MHEQSLIRSLLKQVDELRQQHGGGLVAEVRVQLGPLSGVEPLLLASAFDQLSSETSAGGAKLAVEEVTLLAKCDSCDREFEIHDFVFRCPTCQGNVRVTQGDEFQLVSVSLHDNHRAKDLAL